MSITLNAESVENEVEQFEQVEPESEIEADAEAGTDAEMAELEAIEAEIFYTENVSAYEIPFTGELKDLVRATILIAADPEDGKFRSSYKTLKNFDSLDGTQHNWGGESVRKDSLGFARPSDALLRAGDYLVEWWEQYDAAADSRFVAICNQINEYCQQVAESWNSPEAEETEEVEQAIGQAIIEAVEVAEPEEVKEAEAATPAPTSAEAILHFQERERELERELSNAYIEQKRVEAELKACRKEVEQIGKELSKHRDNGPQYMPLFDDAEKPCDCKPCNCPSGEVRVASLEIAAAEIEAEAEAEAAGPVLDTSDAEAEIETEAIPEAWRPVPLTDTAIPKGILSILAECPDKAILTVGDLADWTVSKPLTKIPRIGKGKADKIEDAMAEFWAGNATG